MIPESMPVFTADDLIQPPAVEYEDEQGRKSTVGWLKSLFMWQEDGDYLEITDKDRKDYAEAAKAFRKVNNISNSVDLHDWEDSTPLTKQVQALNKFRKDMGYTDVFEREA